MKKLIACLLAAVLMASALVGCGGSAAGESAPSASAPEKVRIGIMSIPSPQYIAASVEDFEDSFGGGIEVETTTFSSPPDIVQALMTGELDFIYVGCISAMSGIANGMNAKIIWVDNVIGTTEAIICKQDAGIKTLADLKGKKVATPFVSTSHYILEYALKKAGIDSADVEILNMQPEEIYAAWGRGDIDAAAVWDPVLSSLEGGKILYTGEDVANDSYPVAQFCLVSDAFAEAYPDLVVKFLEPLEKLVQLRAEDEEKVTQMVADCLEISEEDAALQLKGIIWVPAEEQLDKKYFGGDLVDNLMRVADYLYEGGNLTEEVSVETVEQALDPSYIEKMLEG